MNKLNIKGDDLLELGYPKGKAIGTAIRVIEQHLKNEEREEVMAILLKVFQYPESFLDDAVLSPIANELVIKPKMEDGVPVTQLKENPNGYAIYGKQHIEKGAIDQMEIAMKLPVTVAGALMPDAHQG
jgi:tRNA-splicing ligase RtcB